MAKTNGKAADTPIARTNAGLRDALFDEIDAIRAGTSNPTRANAVAKTAATIIDSARLDLEVQHHLQQHASASSGVQLSPAKLGALQLGN